MVAQHETKLKDFQTKFDFYVKMTKKKRTSTKTAYMPEEEIEDNMPDFEEVFKMIGEVKQDLRDEMAVKKDHNDLK